MYHFPFQYTLLMSLFCFFLSIVALQGYIWDLLSIVQTGKSRHCITFSRNKAVWYWVLQQHISEYTNTLETVFTSCTRVPLKKETHPHRKWTPHGHRNWRVNITGAAWHAHHRRPRQLMQGCITLYTMTHNRFRCSWDNGVSWHVLLEKHERKYL